MDPTTPTEWPSNRHNRCTCIMFADGHAEAAKRGDVINPQSDLWRRRWNNDNLPHPEYSWAVTQARKRRLTPDPTATAL
jgi:hypothetical protein